MRIEKIIIKNFRIYKDVEIDFSNQNNDIHLLIGKNGMGKTTFLNAINWCLYNKEPHSYKDSNSSSSLPILNLSHINHTEDVDISVEIIVSSKNSTLSFKRVERYKANNKTHYSNSLTVEEKASNGETYRYKGEEADMMVDTFVPESIREFFFFDGEQLDTYFVDQKADNVKNNIFILSHIDVLDNMVDKLHKRELFFKKEAGKLNPDIDDIVKEIQELEDKKETQEEELKELETQTKKSFDSWNKLNLELNGIPDMDELNEKRNSLESKLSEVNNEIDDKKEDIKEFTFNSSAPILLNSAITKVWRILEDIDDELPPAIDEEELRKSLNAGKCTSCDQHLTENAIAYINKLLNDYMLSSAESKKLLNLKNSISSYENDIDNYPNQLKPHVDLLINLSDEKDELENEMADIEKEFIGRDDKKIVNKFKKLKKMKELYDRGMDEIPRIKVNLEELTKKINGLQKKLDDAKLDSKVEAELLAKQKICHNAIEIIEHTMKEIMDVTKEDIEKFTKNTFFDLIWKQDTYSNIEIDDDYNLKLIHKLTNDNAIGSASAAERQLVALAFTLGVHSISGFKAPLLIDTPLARVSDENRMNFAKVLLDISKGKQMILILTPDEFSDNIKPIFDDSPKFEIEIYEEEFMTNIRRLSDGTA